ncbi:hypothetical protein PsorP6_000185 [Peronosclerospora sorghi]|uniref:Uncharacterized protein n=1 Tax=Peronosclerospora sorghi TaxID=230839 RepID=A0ACC0WP37_9STRA|nr:hypothetical protein PsorP6_000185 [Peronosclerospora sorghi]
MHTRSVDEVCTPVCLREFAISAVNNTSITGSSGGSASPQSNPEFRALRGMCFATTFGTVGSGIMVQSNFSQWREGSLETVAMTIAPWLGVWVGMAAVIATLGEFNVVMACSSRALWATAYYKMLPSFLAIEWKRFGTPITAVIFQTVTTGVLMNFSFEILVVIDTFFNKYVMFSGVMVKTMLQLYAVVLCCLDSLTLLLEFFALLRLKYVEKDAERPFVVPFGNAGAWSITLPKVLVLAGVLIAQKRSGGNFASPNISAEPGMQRAQVAGNVMPQCSYTQQSHEDSPAYSQAGGNGLNWEENVQAYWNKVRELKFRYAEQLLIAKRALANNSAPPNSVYSIKAQSVMDNIGLESQIPLDYYLSPVPQPQQRCPRTNPPNTLKHS